MNLTKDQLKKILIALLVVGALVLATSFISKRREEKEEIERAKRWSELGEDQTPNPTVKTDNEPFMITKPFTVGEKVKQLQGMLSSLINSGAVKSKLAESGTGIDGVYGPRTNAAHEEAMRLFGLDPKINSDRTLSALQNAAISGTEE